MAVTKNKDMIYVNINNVNDNVFNEIIADFTASLANEYFKIDFLNSDNVTRYVHFRDGNNRNLNPNNFILVNRVF